MEVLLLGTGAADGWPNPYCACPSCAQAREGGMIRGQTSALVDERLLLDCGPEAPAAASRWGRDLTRLRHVLITHAHSDHFSPSFLLHRSWVGDDPLDVIGPAAVITACRAWIGPDSSVRLVEVVAGQDLMVGPYRVRVLPAAHEVFDAGDSVLYDVTGPGGRRLLWACDTGLWPSTWFSAVARADYDAVLLEHTFGTHTGSDHGHLRPETFGQMLTGLRAVGAITEDSDVVAVHLSHHNAPEGQLRERLHALGARAGTDGEVLWLESR